MHFKTKEEIDEPYKLFREYYEGNNYYMSIGEIDVVIRAKGGNLFGLLSKGILIQDPKRPSYFKVQD